MLKLFLLSHIQQTLSFFLCLLLNIQQTILVFIQKKINVRNLTHDDLIKDYERQVAISKDPNNVKSLIGGTYGTKYADSILDFNTSNTYNNVQKIINISNCKIILDKSSTSFLRFIVYFYRNYLYGVLLKKLRSSWTKILWKSEWFYKKFNTVDFLVSYLGKSDMMANQLDSKKFNPMINDNDFVFVFTEGIGAMYLKKHSSDTLTYCVDFSSEYSLKSYDETNNKITPGCQIYFKKNSQNVMAFSHIIIKDKKHTDKKSKMIALNNLIYRYVLFSHTFVCHATLGGAVSATNIMTTLSADNPLTRLLIPSIFMANNKVWGAGQVNWGENRALDMSGNLQFKSMCDYYVKILNDSKPNDIITEILGTEQNNNVQIFMNSMYLKIVDVCDEYINLYDLNKKSSDKYHTEVNNFINLMRATYPIMIDLTLKEIVAIVIYSASLYHTYAGHSESFLNPFTGLSSMLFINNDDDDDNVENMINIHSSYVTRNTIISTVSDTWGGEGGLFFDQKYTKLALDNNGKCILNKLYNKDFFKSSVKWIKYNVIRTSTAY